MEESHAPLVYMNEVLNDMESHGSEVKGYLGLRYLISQQVMGFGPKLIELRPIQVV